MSYKPTCAFQKKSIVVVAFPPRVTLSKTSLNILKKLTYDTYAFSVIDLIEELRFGVMSLYELTKEELNITIGQQRLESHRFYCYLQNLHVTEYFFAG